MPRKLSAETERELVWVEKKLQNVQEDQLDPELDCILVILPSIYSPAGILMQRKDNTL